MKLGGLFSGIGGIELGLQRAGFELEWLCEPNPYRRAVLERRFPGIPIHEDIRYVNSATADPVDALCGGFPCQDFSNSGRRAGIGGSGGWLWTEFARTIGELRPRVVLMENVSGLLVRGFGEVIGDLAKIGYDAEWSCFPASAMGAPHRRDRVWIVAYPGVSPDSDGQGSQGRRPPTPTRHGGPTGQLAGWGTEGWSSESGIQRVAYGSTSGLDRSESDVDDQRSGAQASAEGSSDSDLLRDVREQSESSEASSGLRDSGADHGDLSELSHEDRTGEGNLGEGSGEGSQLRGVRASGDSSERSSEQDVRLSLSEQEGQGERRETVADLPRVAYGVPNRVERLEAIGDSVVVPIVTRIGTEILKVFDES